MLIPDIREKKRPLDMLTDEDRNFLADPKDIVAGTVINKGSRAPVLNLQPEPEFDARSSNIFKVLAATGALATLADPGGNLGAAGQGLASGAASVNNQLVQGFLEKQEQALAINTEIQALNAKQEADIEERDFELRVEEAKRRLERRQKLTDAATKRRQDLSDIELKSKKKIEETKASEATKLQSKKDEIEFLRSLPLTDEQTLELNKLESEITENEAQARAADALATSRLDKIDDAASPGVIARTELEIEELETLLREGKETQDSLGRSSRLEVSPGEYLSIRKRLQALYESLPTEHPLKKRSTSRFNLQELSDDELLELLKE